MSRNYSSKFGSMFLENTDFFSQIWSKKSNGLKDALLHVFVSAEAVDQ